MRLTRRSVALIVAAALLAALNLFGNGGPPAVEALPTLPAVVADNVTVVQISTPIEKLRIERESPEKGTPGFDRWRIVTPLDFPADAAQIRTVLRTFTDGLPMDAFVDAVNQEDYGVDDQNGLLVELYSAGQDLPTASVVVGKTAAGPSTFVRIPGSEDVYRADVGGRGRYARPAAEWRDKVALEVDTATVVGLTLTRGAEALRFTRGAASATDAAGKPVPGPWQLDGAAFVVDDETVDLTIRTLARIRAAEIHNPDYDAGLAAPLAEASLLLQDGSSQLITLGTRIVEGAAFVRVAGRDEVFRTAGVVGRAMTQPVEAFRDRRVLSFERDAVASIAYVDRGLTVVLEQSEDGATWAVTQPANMDADQKQALFTANTLAALRAASIPADTRFDATGARFEVRFRDGRSVALELGQTERGADDRPLMRVRATDRDGVYHVRESTILELRKAFGRG
ncbi:MAG: DUF4340 domain-containing protein [Pseudomonadota bacterium]|nr:DUF4340 domain-containing protein [Pseudomonadota bacterium]